MNEEIFKLMNGAVIESITGLEQYSNEVIFYTSKGNFKVYHMQDCCESVALEDFEISAESLIGGVIYSITEEVSQNSDDYYDSETWSFYKMETSKGGLWMRWRGSSNGYYSESVNWDKLDA